MNPGTEINKPDKTNNISDQSDLYGRTNKFIMDHSLVHECLEDNETSLEDKAGVFSNWMLTYLTPLMKLGSEKPLQFEDCGVPSRIDSAEFANDQITIAWEQELKRVSKINAERDEEHRQRLSSGKKIKKNSLKRVEPNLPWVILEAFGPGEFILALFYFFISTIFMFVPVLLLEDLVKFVEEGGDYDTFDGYTHPWVEVVGLGVFPIFVGILQTKSQVIMVHFATYVRTAVSALVFKKQLRISPTAKALVSSGKVFNLMSNDAVQLQKITMWISLGFGCPFLVIIALYLIYKQVGRATWVGVLLLVVSMPINGILFAAVAKMRKQVLKYSDARVSMTNELLSGIRIIKFYAWEKPYGLMVSRFRHEELRYLTLMSYVIAIGFSITIISIPIIQPVAVFYSYMAWESEPLTASKAFTTITLFTIMRFPFVVMPMALIAIAQCYIATKRIMEFLMLPERRSYVVFDADFSDKDKSSKQIGSLSMSNSSFSWSNPKAYISNANFTRKLEKQVRQSLTVAGAENAVENDFSNNVTCALKDITLSINAGSLVAIVGKVGSGKSSFLASILGEMEPVGDSKIVIPQGDTPDFMAFCTQTPWVINDTVRGNITFGRKLNQERYIRVLEACALKDDLGALPAGDLTEIGERGINLSGGQKARVALARAMYSENTKLLLLDDPLSAVDGHVGEHLFANAFCGDISKGTTRLLVTHHVHFLHRCDAVIVLEDGKVAHYGTYDQLVDAGVDFQEAVDISEEECNSPSTEVTKPKKRKSKRKSNKVEARSDESNPEKITTDEKTEEKIETTEKKFTDEDKEDGERLIEDEDRAVGGISMGHYSHYFKAGGILNFMGFVLSQAACRAGEIGMSFWLAHWSGQVTESENNHSPMTEDETAYFLNVFAYIGLGTIVMQTIRGVVQCFHRLHASTKMHDDMLYKILRAPVSFHDVTPLGRILNRFSTDMDRVDIGLPMALLTAANAVALIFGSIVAIIVATKGIFLVPFTPLMILYYRIQRYFTKSATELQRLVNISNSPIFSDFAQTLSGTAVIRAYKQNNRFFVNSQKSFNEYNSVFVLFYTATNWISLRLDFLGGFVQSFIAAIALATLPMNMIPAGFLGLALSFSIEATTYMKQTVRMVTKLEADMSAVERILFYTSDIPEEAPDVVPWADPDPEVWPSNGTIEIKNASMRYRKGPLILKNISVSIKGGEKIGVVGRTGSGKSSLMNALFRVTELENDGGKILVDGIDIGKIGTDILRQNISIIPQDPVLFTSTVRQNIDPFNNASDEEIWQTLDRVELADVISELPLGLEEMVAEGGENFSQGQRQLLCIGRALLRRAKILVMDEATASIDNATDALIQKAVRQNFTDATVLTIAHRLNTIMDSDKVLVLDYGVVMEFDSPSNLLAKTDGLFKDFVERNSIEEDDESLSSEEGEDTSPLLGGSSHHNM